MKKILLAATLVGVAMLIACGGKKGGITMGSLSKFDTLSYALGANIAYSVSHELRDIPFDYSLVEKGITEGALNKASVTHEDAINLLRDYFMIKRGERMQQIAANRAEQDSIRLASGDETPIEHPVADEAMFETEEERAELSHAFGIDIGFNISQSGLPLQMAWVTKAMQEVREGTARMSEDEVNQFLQNYFMVTVPNRNAEESAAWLAKIAKKSGVKKTESGLLYKIIKAGDPEVMPRDPRDVVEVHYTGRNREGVVFDTSIFANRSKEQQEMMRKQNPDGFNADGTPIKADEAVSFPLNRVIPGWTEGMQLIGKGGKIKLWIPAELAYGPRGASREIGPNMALEFEVELINVTPYDTPAPAPVE